MLALVYFLVSTILELRKITAGLDTVIAAVGEIVEKSAPVDEVVTRSTSSSTPAWSCSRACSSRRPGMTDAMGLVDGLYPGAAAAGLRAFPESGDVEAPRIGEVYTRGTLTLARLGREARSRRSPRGRRAAQRRGRQPRGAALYPSVRHRTPEQLPRSPVIGTDAPEQYEHREDIGAPRKRLPAKPS